MENVKIKWSYSSLSLFQQCPKKYYHLRIAKDIKDRPSPQMRYGLDMHKAAELYVRDNVPLPAGFAFMKDPLDKLKNMDGEKFCEIRLGLNEDLEACKYSDKDVWWRGIADLLIINGDEARVVDYKTGKNAYPDTKQLEVLSLAVFKHYPQVKVVKAGLLFVIHVDFVKVNFARENQQILWSKWIPETDRLANAYATNVWNPKINFTCSEWCPVVSCSHNGKSK